MQKYDYGTEAGNQEHYGQPSPPLYNVSRLAVPTYVFYSPADWLADPLDVQVMRFSSFFN